MNEKEILEILDKVFLSVFETKCPYNIEEFRQKYTNDISLPVEVEDFTTKEKTWTISTTPKRFITNVNAGKRDNWMMPKRQFNSIDEIVETWKEINLFTTERNYNTGEKVTESDAVFASERVFRSNDCTRSKNLLFCDSVHNSEYMVACQRSSRSSFCLKTDDCADINNSYLAVGSGQSSNCLIIQDCADLYECIMCAHISGMKYCVANVQFEKEEYFAYKKEIVKWILEK